MASLIPPARNAATPPPALPAAPVQIKPPASAPTIPQSSITTRKLEAEQEAAVIAERVQNEFQKKKESEARAEKLPYHSLYSNTAPNPAAADDPAKILESLLKEFSPEESSSPPSEPELSKYVEEFHRQFQPINTEATHSPSISPNSMNFIKSFLDKYAELNPAFLQELKANEKESPDSTNLDEELNKYLEQFEKQFQPIKPNEGSSEQATHSPSISPNSMNLLKTFLNKYAEINPAFLQEIKVGEKESNDSTNKTMKQCAQFFQDLLNQTPQTLASWLKQQNESGYPKYQVPESRATLCPFFEARQFQKALMNDPNFRSGLDQKIVSAWEVTYVACTEKLKSMNLEAYLDELSLDAKKLEESVAHFLNLANNFPEDKQKAVQWLNQRTDEERGIVYALETSFYYSPFCNQSQLTEKILLCKADYAKFHTQLEKMDLYFEFFMTCLPPEAKKMFENPQILELMKTTMGPKHP